MILNGRYYIDDIEIGLIEVSKEAYEQHLEIKKKVREMCMPRTDKKIGKLFVFGTGEDMNNKGGLEKLFYDPTGYKTIKQNESDT